ncbi:MAG: tetratricopeptide repeat protein [Elusimicrobia bacterium]|nr:tetratricopeptide repeat protein [Elusimicrobiota bacterium]
MKTKRIILLLSGVLFSLMLLESGLRLGGFIRLSIQKTKNQMAIKEKGSYRILCLGDSTTENQWPPYLKEILNKEDLGIKFSVIDKGRSCTNSMHIMAELEDNISNYKPDMLITMMGANDGGYYSDITSIKPGTLKNLKIYKLFKMILLAIKDRSREVQAATKEDVGLAENISDALNMKDQIENSLLISGKDSDKTYRDYGAYFRAQQQYEEAMEYLRKAIEINSANGLNYAVMGQCFKDQGKYELAEKYFKKAVKLGSEDEWILGELAHCLKAQSKYEEADSYFKRLLQVNPMNDFAYCELGSCSKSQGKYKEAKMFFKEAIEVNPENSTACNNLGFLLMEQHKYDESEKYFRKALEIDKEDDWNYVGLAFCFTDWGKHEEAESCFRSAIKINPENEYAYGGLGRSCREQGRSEEAERYLQKAIEIDPENETFYDQLGLCLKSQGKLKEAESSFMQSRKITQTHGRKCFNPKTINNYIKLKKILDKNNIQYVCVQYPMWDVEQLKDIFKEESGIIFVDNKKTFEAAVNESSYFDYFTDAFAGDFGHCTPKGNKLLAENIAREILQIF